MYKRIFAAAMSLFLTMTVFPQSIYAEEETEETTEETVETEEIEQEEEEIPEEIIEEEETVEIIPEEIEETVPEEVLPEETVTDEENTETEEEIEEVIPEAEEPVTEVIAEEESEDVIEEIPSEETEEITAEEVPAKEPVQVIEEVTEEQEEEPVVEEIPEVEQEEVITEEVTEETAEEPAQEVIEEPEIIIEEITEEGTTADASSITINAEKVDLYAFDDIYSGKISIPKGYNKKFQLKVTGANEVNYYVSQGDSVTVSESGLIKPYQQTWYYNGNVGTTWSTGEEGEEVVKQYSFDESIIKVYADSEEFEVKVTVHDYADIYAESVMDNYLEKNITSDMPVQEKMNKIAAFPAQYDYDVRYSSYTGMIILGGGDCWASSDAILYLAQKAGFTARIRDASGDPGAGSGHKNVIVAAGKDNYILEAGYDGTAPRLYSASLVKGSLFEYRFTDDGESIYIYEYKGANAKVTIPSKIDGHPVIALAGTTFYMNETITEVIIPEGVTIIAYMTFHYCINLKKVSLPDSLEYIGEEAFSYCKSLKQIVIPKNVKKIYKCAFKDDESLSSVTFQGNQLEEIGNAAFLRDDLKSVAIPSSVKKIGVSAFEDNPSLKEINVHKNNAYYSSVDGVLFSKDKKTLICYPGGKSASSYTIPDGTKRIEDSAFEDVGKVKKIIVPASVKEVGARAFIYTENLQTIQFLGKAPSFGDEDVFGGEWSRWGYIEYYPHTIVYPANDSTWTTSLINSFNGDLRWKVNKQKQTITAKAKDPIVSIGSTTSITVSGAKGKLSYKSGDAGIASVDSKGTITAKKAGTVKITIQAAATEGYNKASAEITIKVVPVSDSGSGWKKSNGKWWYKLPDGSYYSGTFAKISGKVYYFNNAGYMVTGWKKISGSWYYFTSGGIMVTGWKKISGKWYWFADDGIMAKGWQKITGKWYYFLSGGAMVTGWQKISSKWYYFLSGGAMVTGWKKISGKWYYFTSSGDMKTGWLKLKGVWYYFQSSGAMVTGSVKIGTKTYNFNSSGACLNP